MCRSENGPRGCRRRELAISPSFCGLFQNPRGSTAASTMTRLSPATSAASATHGQTHSRGIYARAAACYRGTIAPSAAESLSARITCCATRTTYTGWRISSPAKKRLCSREYDLRSRGPPCPKWYISIFAQTIIIRKIDTRYGFIFSVPFSISVFLFNAISHAICQHFFMTVEEITSF